MKTDLNIQMDVIDGLSWEFLLNDDKIDVAVNSGIVTLTGMVDSHSKKKLAEEAAWRAPEVDHVENNIIVNNDITSF